MEKSTVRRATDADLETMARINANVFLGDRDNPGGAKEWMECWYRAYPLYQYFVIECDGVVAGYAGWQLHGGFHRAEPAIELDQVGIDRAYQGKGLAPRLIQECMQELSLWMQQKNDRIESHITFIVWGYSFNFNAMSAYAKQFGDGVRGFRIQFGDRSENMVRLRMPIIRPVRE